VSLTAAAMPTPTTRICSAATAPAAVFQRATNAWMASARSAATERTNSVATASAARNATNALKTIASPALGWVKCAVMAYATSHAMKKMMKLPVAQQTIPRV